MVFCIFPLTCTLNAQKHGKKHRWQTSHAARPIVWARKRKKREEAINQTFRHHNSARVISLIKSVWVFPATSSLLNMGQTGIDFTGNEFSSARHINYLSSQLKLKWMVEAQTGKTQLDCLHTQRERRKLDPSWIDASRKRQDAIRLLSGISNSPIFRVLICKLICGWQRQA